MLDAIKVGREHNLEYVYKGLTPPPVLHMKYKFYEKTIYSLLKKTIGIENGRFFPTVNSAIIIGIPNIKTHAKYTKINAAPP